MSLWTLSIKPRAQRDLAHLDNAVTEQVLDKLHWLEKNFDSVVPRRLSADLSDSFKLRVGDYRVIYDFNRRNSIISIYRIEHRSKVYKK